MTDHNETPAVEQRDREGAWPFRAECYGAGDHAGWMRGKYDHNNVIQAFARHRLQHSGKVATAAALEAAWDREERWEGDFVRPTDEQKAEMMAHLSKPDAQAGGAGECLFSDLHRNLYFDERCPECNYAPSAALPTPGDVEPTPERATPPAGDAGEVERLRAALQTAVDAIHLYLMPSAMDGGIGECTAILNARHAHSEALAALRPQAGDADVVGEPTPEAEGERVAKGYSPGYDWYRNKWIGDHKEMIADLVREFVPKASVAELVEALRNAEAIARGWAEHYAGSDTGSGAQMEKVCDDIADQIAALRTARLSTPENEGRMA